MPHDSHDYDREFNTIVQAFEKSAQAPGAESLLVSLFCGCGCASTPISVSYPRAVLRSPPARILAAMDCLKALHGAEPYLTKPTMSFSTVFDEDTVAEKASELVGAAIAAAKGDHPPDDRDDPTQNRLAGDRSRREVWARYMLDKGLREKTEGSDQ